VLAVVTHVVYQHQREAIYCATDEPGSLSFQAELCFTMSKYQPHSTAVVSTISDISTETFQAIRKIDKASRCMSKVLDKKIKSLVSSKALTHEAVHEADLLRKALEALSAGKVQLAVKNYDLIDQNIKIVDQEIALLEKALIENGELLNDDGAGQYGGAVSGKLGGKKRKSDKINAESSETTVDPNEPLYCTCNRIAFGDMIACDNEDCAIEWFHYPCVNLTRKPRNSWVCPTCANKRKRH
jgi:hypothetical protein